MATIDFAKLYSAATVKAWRLPAAASADLANGSFRGLRLVWHDLPADEAGPLSAALRFVCCDVLVLDKNATIDRPTFVFARRIELRGDAGFVLDRTSQPDIDLTLFAQSVVDQKAGAPAVLSVTVVRETGGTASLAPDYSFKTDPDAGATGMVWQPGASAACAMAAKDIDPGHLSIGEPLWLALMTTFQVATLLSTQSPELSIAQLRWVASLGQAGSTTRDLADQANATAGTLQAAQAAGPNTVLVPRLDAMIYASASKELLTVLKVRERKWDGLLERMHNDKNWAADASVMLAETLNQDNLILKLEEQASQTRTQTMQALAVAIGQVVYARMQIRVREIEFQSGIERWKEKKILSEIFNILTGIVQLLAQIPAIVTVGPELAVLPAAEFIGSVGEYIVSRAKAIGTDPGDYMDIPSLFGVEEDVVPVVVGSKPTKAEIAHAKKLKDMQADLVKGLKDAGAAGKAIYDSAMQILSITSTAERLQRTSQAIYGSIDGAVGSAFSSTELQGIDVVTGGEQAWETLRVNIEDVFDHFKDGLLKEIDGGMEYRLEFRRLIVCGMALSQARLAVAKANMQLAEMKLRRAAGEKSVAIVRDRAKQLGQQIGDTETLALFVFNTVIDAKRSVYLAMEAYGRAFRYFTLSKPAGIPKLPVITASVDEFGEAVAKISGRLLIGSILKPIPQTMKQVEISLNEPDMLRQLQRIGYTCWTLDPSHPAFNGFFRIRTDRVRVFAEGIAEPGDIDVELRTSGVYADKFPHGEGVRFVSEPSYYKFRYNGEKRTIGMDTATARRYVDDFFIPTPFTVWTMKIARPNGEPVDLSGLTSLTVQFHGEASAE
jgi:hypothetical protein